MNSGFNTNDILDTFKVPMVPKDTYNSFDSNLSQVQNIVRPTNYLENSQSKPFQQMSQQISQQSPQPGFVAPQMANSGANINLQQQAMEHFVIEEHKVLRKQYFDTESEQQVTIF